MDQNIHSNYAHKVSAVVLTLSLAPLSTHVLLVGKEHYVEHVLKVTNKALSVLTVYPRAKNVI